MRNTLHRAPSSLITNTAMRHIVDTDCCCEFDIVSTYPSNLPTRTFSQAPTRLGRKGLGTCLVMSLTITDYSIYGRQFIIVRSVVGLVEEGRLI